MPHLLIVTAQFYTDIAEPLLAGAEELLRAEGMTFDTIDVPGVFEIPGAIRFAAASGRYDGYIALGCVIRGETTHYDYVCTESARGLMDLTIQAGLAIGNGILTVENKEQAFARADGVKGKKGTAAAQAALTMIALRKKYSAANK